MAIPHPVRTIAALVRTREPLPEEGLIRLDRNERQQPLPSWFMVRLREALQSDLLTTYPSSAALYRQLSRTLGLEEERLLLTSGSDAAIKALYQVYVRPREMVVMLEPSYGMYEVYARMVGARACQVPFDAALAVDVQALLDAVRPGVRLVMIANPNQPTGTLLPKKVLQRLVARTRSVGALLVIDEAYYPFSHMTVLPWVREVPHLVVLRTFSKASGLAGLRIGFAVGHRQVMAELFKVRSVYDVTSVAMRCASEVLAHPQIVDEYVAAVEAGRAALMRRARGLGLVPRPSSTNFLLIRIAHRCTPAALAAALRQRGYLVRASFDHPSLAEYIRVTLGPPDLMDRFAGALAQALAEAARVGNGA